jgi:hypothetical protein
MITILLSALLSCSDAAWIIQGIEQADITQAEKSELILTVMDGTDRNCDLTAALEAEPRR